MRAFQLLSIAAVLYIGISMANPASKPENDHENSHQANEKSKKKMAKRQEDVKEILPEKKHQTIEKSKEQDQMAKRQANVEEIHPDKNHQEDQQYDEIRHAKNRAIKKTKQELKRQQERSMNDRAFVSGAPQQRIINVIPANQIPSLGELYVASTETLLTGTSVWSKKTLDKKTWKQNATTINTDFRYEETLMDRLLYMKIEAELKLSLMAGKLAVEGSLAFMFHKKTKSNMVQVGLHFQSTNKMLKMPTSTPVDYSDRCSIEGVTHVVTAVTHGLNAHMIFQKAYTDYQDRLMVAGSLRIVVKMIPKVGIEAYAKANFTFGQQQTMQNMDVNFYGDVLIDTPTSYQQAIETYQKLPELARNSERVIAYTLTPISQICSGVDAFLSSISESYIDRVVQIMDDFAETETEIYTLASSVFATKFIDYYNVLVTLRVNFLAFKNEFTERLLEVLPNLRKGTAARQELVDIVDMYDTSKYSLPILRTFFATRTKEMETLANILFDRHGEEHMIKINYKTNGEGNKCLQDHAKVLYFRLNALPSEANVAESYHTTAVGQWSEKDKWFHNRTLVRKVGYTFQQDYLGFLDVNKDKDICFLILIEEVTDQAKPNQIDAEYVDPYGKHIKIEDFKVPGQVKDAKLLADGCDSLSFEVSFLENEYVDGLEIKMWNVNSQESSGDAKVFEDYFLTSTTTTSFHVTLKGLDPNTIYGITFQLNTPIGVGAASNPRYAITRPTSPPKQLRIADGSLKPNEVVITWDVPEKIASDVYIEKYKWVLWDNNDNSVVKEGFANVDEGNIVHLSQLVEADYYTVTLEAFTSNDVEVFYEYGGISSKSNSLMTSLPFVTPPLALNQVVVTPITISTATVTWNAYSKIPAVSTFLGYNVRLQR